MLGSGFHLSWGGEHRFAHNAQGEDQVVPQRNGSTQDWERKLSPTCLCSDLEGSQGAQTADKSSLFLMVLNDQLYNGKFLYVDLRKHNNFIYEKSSSGAFLCAQIS